MTDQEIAAMRLALEIIGSLKVESIPKDDCQTVLSLAITAAQAALPKDKDR